MARIIEITSPDDPRINIFARLTDAQLRNCVEADKGLFIAESPKVIATALDSCLAPVALLCEKRHLDGDAAPIITRLPEETPVFTGERQVLATLTGYTLTRGVLCAMNRPTPTPLSEVAPPDGRRRVVVIDGVSDSTNIGAIFRTAAALGWDGIILSTTACHPLNRRVVRVSMGTVFRIPWTIVDDPISTLRAQGYKTLAMALRNDSVTLDDDALQAVSRLAIMVGEEGYGLAKEVIAQADFVARIPMARGIDSLNVSNAASIALYALR